MKTHPSVIAILASVTAAIMLPYYGSASLDLDRGRRALAAGNYAAAASELERAAIKLAWKPGLWEAAGLAAYAGRDYSSAIRLLSLARQEESLSAAGWEVLGTSLWAVGRPGDAMLTWEEGSRQNSSAPELLDRLAAAHHELRDYAGEELALNQRLQLQDDAGAHYRLALLLLTSDPVSARSHLDAAVRLNPDVAPAAATLTAALSKSRSSVNRADGLVIVGRSLGLVEEWALAARVFRQAVEADGSSAEAHAWLGEALQHINENGRPELDTALSLGRNNPVVHTLAGLYWRRKGNLGVSLAEYARASQLDPQSAALQSLVGEAYTASGDLVSALEAYQNAVELSPAESTYWRMLALFCADNEVQVLEIGVAAGLKAVELSPHDPQALDALGWAYAQSGYLTKAEASLKDALKQEPDFALGHLHLGLTYMRWGQNNLALDHLNEAARLDPSGAAGQAALSLLKSYQPPGP